MPLPSISAPFARSDYGKRSRTPGAATVAETKATASVDLVREALHTTGTVGTDDRSIVVVLTLHPDGTSFSSASTAVSKLTRARNWARRS
ncbi:hypothetical protein [Dactylosporangium sp. CA-092794]|uniref:hypothetical protein n=1 Tax=Dactylosporangium sp. CA-092794 TaxID=3239929 RepID=UPI003D94D015